MVYELKYNLKKGCFETTGKTFNDSDSAYANKNRDTKELYEYASNSPINGKVPINAEKLAEDFSKYYSENYYIFRCKSCGCITVISISEKEWFIKKGLSVPKRCAPCRTHIKK